MSRFSRIAAAVAAVLLFAGTMSVARQAHAQDKPASAAKAKPAKKKADKAAKKQAKFNVKSSLGTTDKLLKVAEKAGGKSGHADLREASVQQLAARKALAAGKDKQALFLSLEARRIARGIITDTGGKIPKELAADQPTETENTDGIGIDSFVTEAQDEIPEAIDDHEDGLEDDTFEDALPVDDEEGDY